MSSRGDRAAPAAVVFGCAADALGADERAFFAEADPLGFILFGRNCRTPSRLRRLIAALRASVGRPDAPILIDQEGGRVARLGPPHWRARPPPAAFGRLAARAGAAAACAAARTNARSMARELAELGIGVACAPSLDLAVPGAHRVIGDRAFAAEPALVAALGRAVCEGFRAEGVQPVVKHAPGHGRAVVDSHRALPAVDAPAALLAESDFAPFRALADTEWAMTAHVRYTAIDAARPATVSPEVVGEIVRGLIGFDGFLITDDIGMGALAGPLAERARAALAAGCDAVLHCSGGLAEMRAVMAGVGPLTARALARLGAGRTPRPDSGACEGSLAASVAAALDGIRSPPG